MRGRLAAMRVLGAAAALLVAGCASTEGTGGGAAVTQSATPDLLGTWAGTWADTPVTLVITEQGEAGREGIYVGSWILVGRKAPAVTGVLTSTVRGRTVTAAAWGVVAPVSGGVTVTLNTSTTFGDQYLRLKSDGPDRLVGNGESPFGPSGAVSLTRAR